MCVHVHVGAAQGAWVGGESSAVVLRLPPSCGLWGSSSGPWAQWPEAPHCSPLPFPHHFPVILFGSVTLGTWGPWTGAESRVLAEVCSQRFPADSELAQSWGRACWRGLGLNTACYSAACWEWNEPPWRPRTERTGCLWMDESAFIILSEKRDAGKLGRT